MIMSNEHSEYELIDRLCGVTTQLADLVRKQAAVIMQADIPDETMEALEAERQPIDDEMDQLEYRMRRM